MDGTDVLHVKGRIKGEIVKNWKVWMSCIVEVKQ